jgi:signal recognition particle subunit SRP54
MFDRLTDKLAAAFKKLKGHGKLTEDQVGEGLREVRLALLEADVNYKVTKAFIERVKVRAVGEEVLRSLTPAQQVVKIVHEELTALLGGESPRLDLSGRPPLALMLVGLQGCGKTTTAAKLARRLKSQGRQVYLVPSNSSAWRKKLGWRCIPPRRARIRWPSAPRPWRRPTPRAMTR